MVARNDEDRGRLLAFYRDRVAGYADAGGDYGDRWRTWCRALLGHGGELVVPHRDPDPDLDELLASGTPFTCGARSVEGDANACHANAAALWASGEVASIGTGYALSADGLWRQHSWGVDADGTVVETTDDRVAYVGATLDTTAALRFAWSNNVARVKAVLAQGGDRASELFALLRAAAAESTAGTVTPGAAERT